MFALRASRAARPIIARAFHGSAASAGVVPRQAAPAFKLPAVVGTEISSISLESYKGKWVVLFSYPLDFTFVCPTELIAMSDRVKDFEAANAQVLGLSVDSVFSHLAWQTTPRNKGGLGGVTYPLLSDLGGKVSREYGCLITDPADADANVTYRATYIIDPKGTVRSVTINDLPVGRSVDEVLRTLKAFQFVEEHGEVCPANWTPGAKTMKADPVGSQEYFAAVNKK